MFGNDSFIDRLKGSSWAKWVGGIGLILCLVAGFTVPSVLQGNEIAAINTRVAENEAVMATDTELADAIAPLATLLELQAVDDELQAHLIAYGLYVLANDEAVLANTADIETFKEWLADFYGDDGEWAEFLEEYEEDLELVWEYIADLLNKFNT